MMVLSDNLCSYNKTSLSLLSLEAGTEGGGSRYQNSAIMQPLIPQHSADTLFFNDAGFLKITTEFNFCLTWTKHISPLIFKFTLKLNMKNIILWNLSMLD